jgi:predicted dehydrogenase
MKNTKVGIVGLGRQGMLHFMNCFKIDGIEVVGVADSSKNALARARSFGVSNLYSNYNDLFKAHPDLDAVLLSVPNFLHLPSIEAALEAGFDVFAEKPLANTVEECEQIVNLVRKSGRKLMIGHNHRFYEAIERIKSDFDNGFIGDLEAVTAEEIINGPFAHPAVPKPVAEWWFDSSKAGGGALLDVGYHMIDLFRFIAGDAEVAYSYLGHRLNLPLEDSAIAILKSKNNVKGIINVGWYERTVFPQFNFRVILHGNAGFRNTSDFAPKNLYSFAVKVGLKNIFNRAVRKKIRPLRYTYFYESYFKELEYFFGCVQSNVMPSISAEDGLKTLQIIQRAYSSAKEANING